MTFKKSFFATATATAFLVTSGGVIAADSADLSMTGRIVPASCDILYSNGGAVDYGDIQTASLGKDTMTTLRVQQLTWNIDCTGPVPVAMKWTDNKEADGRYSDGIDLPQPFHFSIGKDSTSQPIGRLYMSMGTGPDNITVSGGPAGITEAAVLRSVDGVNWVVSPTSEPYNKGWTSFAHTGTDPVAFQTYAGILNFIPTIAPTNLLDLTSSLDFEASVTMDLEYL